MVQSRKGPKGGRHLPVVIGFFICEKTRTEPDQVISAIRIVDTLNVSPEALEPVKRGDALGTQLNLVLIPKSGDAKGEYPLKWRLLNPSLQRENVGTWKYKFTPPPESGYSIRSILNLKLCKPGIYWFEA